MKKEPKKSKWVCDECSESFKLKRDLVEHLKDEFEEHAQISDIVSGQLESLGIKDIYY